VSDDIAAFIRDRLDEDEARARSAAQDGGDRWHYSGHSIVSLPEHDTVATGTQDHMEPHHAHHIAAHDPARVLRQTAAIRAVVDHAEAVTSAANEPTRDPAAADEARARAEELAVVLRHLAAIWSEHPQPRKEWTT
jgi:hypothetical protein